MLYTLFLLSSTLAFGQQFTSVDRISYGMTFEQVKKEYPNATFSEVPLSRYAVDGGGDGTKVSIDGKDQFVFWLDWQDTTTIGGIIVLSEDIFLDDGVRVGLTVEELLTIYPDIETTIGIFGEEIAFRMEHWHWITFDRDEENPVAEYIEDEAYGEPKFVRFINQMGRIHHLTLINNR